MEKFLKALKSYYIVFSVCVICVISALTIFGIRFYKEQKLKETALEPPPVYVNPAPVVSKTEKEIKKETEKKNTQKQPKEPVYEENSVNTMAIPVKTDFKINVPVGSKEILKEYSADELVYSNTFEDYRVHTGVDIKCKRSEAVFSVADGVVENVYTDPMEGIIIEINHNNGFKSIYKNLSSGKMVKKGETVEKGQVISGVGETAIFESADENHIHFELKKDDKYVNPMEYLE